jgi:hypothetical protein
MRTWTSRVFVAVLSLVALYAALVFSQLMPPTSAAQRVALERLKWVPVPPDVAGNSFAFYWTLEYDLTPAQRLDILRADTMRAERIFEQGGSLKDFEPGVPDGAIRHTISAEDAQQLCGRHDDSCLSKVRANREAVREVLKRHEALIRRYAEAGAFRRHLNPLPPTLDTPIPRMGEFGLVLSDAALRYDDGDRSGAKVLLCSAAGDARKMRHGTNSLVADMIAISRLNLSAALLAEMIAEDASGESIPSRCVEVFSPLRDEELDQCEEMRAEAKVAINNVRELTLLGKKSFFGAVANRFVINPRHTNALLTVNRAILCSAAHDSEIRLRTPTVLAPPQRCTAFEQAFDFLGCLILLEPQNPFTEYYSRVIDVDVTLRAMATIFWLRSQEGSRTESFAALPDSLRDPNGSITLSPDGDFLNIRVYCRKGGIHPEDWQLPLVPRVQDVPAHSVAIR